MSSDLRETLRHQADTVGDGDSHARLGAVRDRVRRVRRRRQGAGLVAVVALVVAVAGGTALVMPPHEDRVVPAEVVGREVPRTTTSLGATYRLSDTTSASGGRLDVDLAAADRPRVVRWASRTSAGRLVLSGSVANPAWTTPAGGFTTFVLVPAGVSASLHLRQVGTAHPGDVAMAVYTFTKPSPGVTVQGVTFRDRVDGEPLVGAAIGRRGEAAASVRLGGFSGPLSLRILCDARTSDSAEVSVAGHKVGSVSCLGGLLDGRDRGLDGADSSQGTLTTGESYAGTPELSVRLVGPKGGRVEPRPGDRVAVGAYLAVQGGGLPDQLDVDGHTWSLRDLTVRRIGATPIRLRVTGDRRYLVHWNVPVGSGTLRIGSRTVPISSGSGGRTFGDTELDAGSHTVALAYDQPPTGRARIGVYDLGH